MTLQDALNACNIFLYRRYVTDEFPAAYRDSDNGRYIVEGWRESPFTVKSAGADAPIESAISYSLLVQPQPHYTAPTRYDYESIEELELFLMFDHLVRVDEGWQPILPLRKRQREFAQ